MPKSIVSITKKLASGKEETIDFSQNESLYKFRVEHFRKEIDKLGHTASPEQFNRIKGLAEAYAKRQGERQAQIFQLDQEDRKDFLECLQQHLNILKE